MIKRCVICDAEFATDLKRTRYCPECSAVVHSHKRKTTVKLGGVMQCTICGREIIRTVATKKYCAACHELVRKGVVDRIYGGRRDENFDRG